MLLPLKLFFLQLTGTKGTPVWQSILCLQAKGFKNPPKCSCGKCLIYTSTTATRQTASVSYIVLTSPERPVVWPQTVTHGVGTTQLCNIYYAVWGKDVGNYVSLMLQELHLH